MVEIRENVFPDYAVSSCFKNEARNKEVDFDTAVLLVMATCAYGWFISIGIFEERKEIKARELAEIERQKRARRLEKLYGRQQ